MDPSNYFIIVPEGGLLKSNTTPQTIYHIPNLIENRREENPNLRLNGGV